MMSASSGGVEGISPTAVAGDEEPTRRRAAPACVKSRVGGTQHLQFPEDTPTVAANCL